MNGSGQIEKSPMPSAPRDVIDFWREAGPDKWFTKDAAFDDAHPRALPRDHEAAAAGALDGWGRRRTARSRFLILSTSFRAISSAATRAPSRPTPWRARSRTARSRAASTRASPRRASAVSSICRFEHSENLADQERCVELNARAGRRGSDWNGRKLTATSSAASAASRIATPCSAARRRRRKHAYLDGGGFAG